MPGASQQRGQQLSAFRCLRHTAILVLVDAVVGKAAFTQVFPMPCRKRQKREHIRIYLMPLCQWFWLRLCILGAGLLGHGVHVASPAQLHICLFVGQTVQSGIQRNAVAGRAAQVAAVLVCIYIEAQMIFPLTVVTAEGTACLDLPMPKRRGVKDKPAPSGRVYDGDLFIGTSQRAHLLPVPLMRRWALRSGSASPA